MVGPDAAFQNSFNKAIYSWEELTKPPRTSNKTAVIVALSTPIHRTQMGEIRYERLV